MYCRVGCVRLRQQQNFTGTQTPSKTREGLPAIEMNRCYRRSSLRRRSRQTPPTPPTPVSNASAPGSGVQVTESSFDRFSSRKKGSSNDRMLTNTSAVVSCELPSLPITTHLGIRHCKVKVSEYSQRLPGSSVTSDGKRNAGL